MAEVQQNRLVSESFVKRILENLHVWLPFRKKQNGSIVQIDKNGNTTNITSNENEIALGQYNLTDSNTILSIGIGDKISRKNAVKITKDGNIYIVTNFKNQKVESLQESLDRKGVEICNSYEEMLPYISQSYIGKCLYLPKPVMYESKTFEEGLYIVSLSTQDQNNIKLFKIGDSLQSDLSNYYTKDEVDEIVKNIAAGDLTDIYYSKDDIDEMLSAIAQRLENIETFIDEPIDVIDLELIVQKDLSGDGIIGK